MIDELFPLHFAGLHEAGSVSQTHEHKVDFKEWWKFCPVAASSLNPLCVSKKMFPLCL